jgi:hypothetical protein
MGRRIAGIALIALALFLFAGPALTFFQVWRTHAAGLGPRAVTGVAYLLTAGGFCLIAGLYFLTAGKNKKV